MPIELSSSAFEPGAAIPREHTCEGADVSPPLAWRGVPDGTRSLALIVDDPDAPTGTFAHWIVYGLPPASRSVRPGGPLPAGAKEGRNDFRQRGYRGPCPPSGKPHRYFFRLYALDAAASVRETPTRRELLAAMEGHTLDRGELMGTFGR